MKKIILHFVVFISVTTFVSSVFAAAQSRVDEIVLWKISEELALSPVLEKKFTGALLALNEEKSKLNVQMDEQIKKISEAVARKKPTGALVKEYRALLKRLALLNASEVEKLTPILGEDKMAKYIVLKSEINQRLKTLILSNEASKTENKATPAPEATPRKDLGEPKFIIEQ